MFRSEIEKKLPNKQTNKQTIKRKRSDSIEHTCAVSKGKYDLTTKAKRKVVGRNKQLDEGTDRQTCKCRDPLNCVDSVVFRKHSTWEQTWIGIFGGCVCVLAETLTSVIQGIARHDQLLLKSAWLVRPYL